MEKIDLKGLKVGDKVRINENCISPYIGLTGIITSIEEGESDDFVLHILFDEFLENLGDEYFSPREVDKIL